MYFFFFKQKTAYEMRISDWSSDVCSSDLMFEHRATEGADAGAIFDEQLGIFPVDGSQHVADQRRRRRHDRSDHDRVLDEAADEHAPRPEKTFEAHPRSEEHTSELQSLMRISYAVFCLKKKKKHKRQRHNDQNR